MLKDTFCSSPWFHVRIDSQGYYRPCRWASLQDKPTCHIKDMTIQEYYNSPEMTTFRQDLLNGKECDQCKECYYQDSVGKVCGRTRQLFKSNIKFNDFDKDLAASPHYLKFKFSAENDGLANYHTVDLQVDLGNTCNGACVMCHPFHSSKLVQDFNKLNVIEPTMFDNTQLPPNWTNDPALVESIINQLIEIPQIKYLHLLGGETLYIDAFYKICDALINNDKARSTIIGTTTNCTIFNDSIITYIDRFYQFHLGLSIEAVTKLNDYIRYPSNIEETLGIINSFLIMRESAPGSLLLSARLTPSLLSVYELDQTIEWLMERNIPAETCNILSHPPELKIELLPDDVKEQIINKLNFFILKNNLKNAQSGIVDTRHIDNVKDSLNDIVVSMVTLLEESESSKDLTETVKFIKALESLRNNKIIDYIPEYKDFLEENGYK